MIIDERLMRNSFAIKALVLVISVAFALVVAEIIVRLTTIYPNTLSSNREYDENIGFRASSKIPEIDKEGFRNPPGTPKEIIAIGDSQTFGFNVRSASAWPPRLSQMIGKKIYNFGSGGYGLLTYHALLHLYRKPETKAALIALTPANDFELFYASDADCLILDHPSAFWRNEKSRLGLEWPAYPVGCLHDDSDAQSGSYQRLKQKIAILALTHDAIVSFRTWLENELHSPGQDIGQNKELFSFPDDIDPVTVKRIDTHIRSVDPQVPEVAAMMKNFPLLMKSWKSLSSEGLKVGVMVISSRERVIYDYFDRQNRLSELDARFVTGVRKQIELERYVRKALEESGLSFVFNLEEMHLALAYGKKNNVPLYPRSDDGHPLDLGYAAYASAARRLVNKMNLQP